MDYARNLSPAQLSNARIITQACKAAGLGNPFTIAAILAIASKESELVPQDENLNYTASRIMQVWPKTSAADAARMAHNPQALAEKMYGGRYGNNAPGDGYRYRGRGFNQITFRDRYNSIGKALGEDLINNPDLLNDPQVAARALVAYMKALFVHTRIDPNGFKDLQSALENIYQANAGKVGQPIRDTTGGFKKAQDRVGGLYTMVTGKAAPGGGSWRNTLGILAGIIGGAALARKILPGS